MTTFVTAYLIVWLTMTLYILRLSIHQRRIPRVSDDKGLNRCC
jgi:hypothetical protein